ncbi:MAG: S53 family peptidase [Acidobacteriia bacterium]|nr:S53 family peptidase [Terriglobia bacterium]
MGHQRATATAAWVAFVISFCCFPVLAQTAFSVHPQTRITGTLDERARVSLSGNRHPLARAENEAGPVPPDLRMERMILALDSDPEQQRALEELLADQHNPHSARYRQWLTPEDFGQQFGISDPDLGQVTNWLTSHGLTVDEIPAGRRAIVFSGSAGQVESAFHTQMRAYRVDGQMHYANATDPEIPLALAGVVGGVVALHDFRSRPALAGLRAVPAPQFAAAGGTSYLAPADFATIYDLSPLYQSSVEGTGQSIAVVGRSNIRMPDVQTFRSYFGLPANNPTVILNGSDPGILNNNEQSEATLDVEWAGAVAKNAAIKFVVSASGASDGASLSASYIVNHNVAPVLTLSFGLCEAALGSGGNAWINSLWQQAAAQGITVLVSSGDSGAAECDAASAATAVHGAGVNGLCSTPSSTCVGGTEFNDKSSASLYWSSAADPVTKASAVRYIPETTWNDSGIVPGGSGLWSTGGGASTVYAKPAWQTGYGVPADGRRDVPDVSLNASVHDGYLIYMNGGLYATGGTSAAAPSFAGLVALVNQKTGASQGNANPTLYTLASNQQNGGAAVFHDVATGSNTVPGFTGFSAGPGYDPATGLGSVDGAVMVNHWADAPAAPAPGLQVGLSASALSVAQGANASINVTVGVSGGFSSAVQLAATGVPAGVTASFTPSSLGAPGSGASTLALSVDPQRAPAGTYFIQVSASGGTVTQSAFLTLTITQPSGLAVTLGSASLNLIQRTTVTASVTVSVMGNFRAPVSLSVTGLPGGMTALVAPATFASPGSGSGTLLLSAGTLAAPGSYTLHVNAAGGGVTQSASLNVTVALPPSFTLSDSQSSVSLGQGASAAVTVGTSVANGFNSAIALAAAGLPAGVTAAFSVPSLAAPGAGASTLTLNAAAAARAGTYAIWITAGGGGLSASLPLVVAVVPPPNFSLASSAQFVSAPQGGKITVILFTSGSSGFNSPVALAVSGLPAGVTPSFSPATMAAPGSGSSALTLSVAPSAPTGSQVATITATGGGITKTLSLTVTVTVQPNFTLKPGAAAANVTQGSSTAVVLTVTGVGAFSSPVALSVAGLPAGVTATFSIANVPGTGTHTSTMNLVAASNAATGPATLTITATGGGITNTAKLTLNVAARTH